MSNLKQDRRKTGFRALSGPAADEVARLAEEERACRSAAVVAGNIDRPAFTADFTGCPTVFPINYVAIPGRKLDYCVGNFQPGISWPKHLHDCSDELYLVLSGRGKVTIGDTTYDAGPGDVFHVLAGTWHSVEVPEGNTEDLRIFGVMNPIPFFLRVDGWAITPEMWQHLPGFWKSGD